MSRFDLIIFDCDGVLVDSEYISQEVLSKMLARIDITMSPDEVGVRFMSKTLPQCIELAESLHGSKLNEEFIDTWRQELYDTFRSTPVQAIDGVHDLVATLDVSMCVVSNGPFEKMRTTLGVTGLLPYFENKLFSPELGIEGKPSPDLFFAAAQAFEAEPGRCAVIEDSAGGVRGAVAAGMQPYGFTGLPHINVAALEAAGAKTFATMRELKVLLTG